MDILVHTSVVKITHTAADADSRGRASNAGDRGWHRGTFSSVVNGDSD